MSAEFVGLWDETLSNAQYLLISFFLSAAALAIFSGFLRAWLGRNEIGPRYRSSSISRLSATAMAFMAYAGAMAQTRLGYDLVDGSFVPNDSSMDTFTLQYFARAIALPLIAAAFIAVTGLIGARARWTITLTSFFGFATMLCAYIGAFAVDRADSGAVVAWGAIGLVFFVGLNAVLVWALRQSTKALTPSANRVLRHAYGTLAASLAIYFIAYFLQICTSGGGWATAVQIISSVGDVALLVIVGELIHRVAKLRTAEDVRAGVDVHPESIWISSIKQSDAGRPAEVYLDTHALVHDRRPKPPSSSAVALEQYEVPEPATDDFIIDETHVDEANRSR